MIQMDALRPRGLSRGRAPPAIDNHRHVTSHIVRTIEVTALLLISSSVWAVGNMTTADPYAAATSSGDQSPVAGHATIDRVAWLQGCWELSSGDRLVEEQWTRPRGGIMLGVGRTTRDGRLIEYETVVLRQQEGRLAYEAHPSGQEAAVFLSTEVTDTRVVFENSAHDFPQRVGYELRSPDALSAWVEGDVKGQSRRIDFPYRRVSCP
jgi:hypothetical protein